jgi:hypothetical protein
MPGLGVWYVQRAVREELCVPSVGWPIHRRIALSKAKATAAIPLGVSDSATISFSSSPGARRRSLPGGMRGFLEVGIPLGKEIPQSREAVTSTRLRTASS